jgi:hypothetical protein
MHGNAISFANPMPKIDNVLLPPIGEMDEVLAFIYTGPCRPTKQTSSEHQPAPSQVTVCLFQNIYEWSGHL